MKKRTVQEMIAEYNKNIDEETARWKHILKYGASDPFWPDGTNMNLIRNHIIYYLSLIAELETEPRQLSIFDTPSQADVLNDRRIPRKVNNNYMATDRKLNVSDEQLQRLVRVP